MAAVIKAINAKIRSNPVSDYLCSTHFWGPASNFGIPIAAVMDTQKDPEYISAPMTGALIAYSAVFARYALAVTPKNYLLFGCHVINFSAQTTQGYRYLSYWNLGGREKALEEKAKDDANSALSTAKDAVNEVSAKAKNAVNEASTKAQDAANKLVGKK